MGRPPIGPLGAAWALRDGGGMCWSILNAIANTFGCVGIAVYGGCGGVSQCFAGIVLYRIAAPTEPPPHAYETYL
jgi:hypothetical protein